MSVITEVVLYCDAADIINVAKINDWCFNNDIERHQTLSPLNTLDAGGSKFVTSYVYAAAFNHFPYEDLIRFFETFKDWNHPEKAVMIVNHDNKFNTTVHFPEL